MRNKLLMATMAMAVVGAAYFAVTRTGTGWAAEAGAGAGAGDKGVAVGAEAPGFSLQDQQGKMVSLADYKGKIVVLEWMNWDCPICMRHVKAKTMVKLADKYKDKEVVWIGINSTNYAKTADNLAGTKTNGIGYLVLNDASGKVGHAYAAKTTPHMFIISKEGKVLFEGGIDDDPAGSKTSPVNYVDAALGEIIAGKSVSVAETKPYGCSVKYKE